MCLLCRRLLSSLLKEFHVRSWGFIIHKLRWVEKNLYSQSWTISKPGLIEIVVLFQTRLKLIIKKLSISSNINLVELEHTYFNNDFLDKHTPPYCPNILTYCSQLIVFFWIKKSYFTLFMDVPLNLTDSLRTALVCI